METIIIKNMLHIRRLNVEYNLEKQDVQLRQQT